MPEPRAQHPWFAASATPRVLAHRGLVTAELAAQHIAENSFAAIAAAHAAGARYIESDCHVTADDEVVLFHDEDLSRVTGVPGKVADVPVRHLEKVMARLGGIITLRQALESFPEVAFNIDVKSDAAALPAGRIVARHAERVLLTSFDDRRRIAALEAARDVRPSQLPATSAGKSTIARLVWRAATRATRGMTSLLEHIDALQIPEKQGAIAVLSPRLLDAAHEAGVEVHVWTVNLPADMTRLREIGVDGIVTDRADLALRMFPPDGG